MGNNDSRPMAEMPIATYRAVIHAGASGFLSQLPNPYSDRQRRGWLDRPGLYIIRTMGSPGDRIHRGSFRARLDPVPPRCSTPGPNRSTRFRSMPLRQGMTIRNTGVRRTCPHRRREGGVRRGVCNDIRVHAPVHPRVEYVAPATALPFAPSASRIAGPCLEVARTAWGHLFVLTVAWNALARDQIDASQQGCPGDAFHDGVPVGRAVGRVFTVGFAAITSIPSLRKILAVRYCSKASRPSNRERRQRSSWPQYLPAWHPPCGPRSRPGSRRTGVGCRSGTHATHVVVDDLDVVGEGAEAEVHAPRVGRIGGMRRP